MQEKFLLSICIPTYNRCNCLRKTLLSIVRQDPFKKGLIEIVISDNASTDGTEEVARLFVKEYSNIRYIKNEVNIKDKNFPVALSRGKGLVRKLSNDTHIFLSNSLGHICKLIESNLNKRPVIFLGNGATKAECKNYNFSEAINAVSFNMTAIANLCFWEEDCIEIENDINDCDLQLWQVRKFLELANKKNKIIIDNTKLFKVQVYKKCIAYSLYDVFYTNYLGLLFEYVKLGKLKYNSFEMLEKDVLYNFFIPWIARWEIHSRKLIFLNNDALKEKIFSICKQKPYWKDFKQKYKFEVIKYILTRPLAFVKHDILHK